MFRVFKIDEWEFVRMMLEEGEVNKGFLYLKKLPSGHILSVHVTKVVLLPSSRVKLTLAVEEMSTFWHSYSP